MSQHVQFFNVLAPMFLGFPNIHTVQPCLSPGSQAAWQDTRWNESKEQFLLSLSLEFVKQQYSLIVGLMKGLVKQALLIVISVFCNLADHGLHTINLMFSGRLWVWNAYNINLEITSLPGASAAGSWYKLNEKNIVPILQLPCLPWLGALGYSSRWACLLISFSSGGNFPTR